MKNLLQNEQFQLDEIVFEKRNKDYGAYLLRANADQTLTKAMIIGVGVVAMMAITPLVVNVFHQPATLKIIPAPPVFNIQDVDVSADPPQEIISQHVKPPKVATIDSRLVTPTRNPKVETKMPKQSAYEDVVIGTENIIGEPPLIKVIPPTLTTPETAQPKGSTQLSVDNRPKTTVDIEAEFVGGIDVFRNKVISRFDISAIEGTTNILKTTVMFIVEKDGSISNVKATGPNSDVNFEAEKTIKSIKGKWTPAKLNGEIVRSYFKFPITMRFE